MTDSSSANKAFYARTFEGVDRAGREIDGCTFDGCTFFKCDFSDAIFNRCKFVECSFINCNLSLVKLEYSTFREVHFDGCKMLGIDWTRAAWPSLMFYSPIKLERCILSDSSFYGLKLDELTLCECKAHHVDFREASLQKVNFTYSDFSCSLFDNSNLSGADFREAINYDIDIHGCRLKGAKFSRFEAVRLLQSLDIELVD